jgi:hypothetical protein
MWENLLVICSFETSVDGLHDVTSQKTLLLMIFSLLNFNAFWGSTKYQVFFKTTYFGVKCFQEQSHKHTNNKKFWEEPIAYFPWYDESNNSSTVAAVTFLPIRCLATIRGFLPRGCLATIGGYTDTHTHTQTATWSRKSTCIFSI